MKRTLLSIAIVLLATTAVFAESATWNIDPTHSTIGFSVRHMMVSNVRGTFDKFSGTITGDPADPKNAKVDVTIAADSINTRNGSRDEHLKSADFFDTTKFPTITFVSKKVESAGEGKLRVVGDFTMHGVTREVVLTVEGPTAPVQVGPSVRSGASATAKVSRKDYGLTWNRAMEAGGMTVGDDVVITIDLELVKQKPEEAKPTS
jgi:polyisoprenoid-binding protein YceI